MTRSRSTGTTTIWLTETSQGVTRSTFAVGSGTGTNNFSRKDFATPIDGPDFATWINTRSYRSANAARLSCYRCKNSFNFSSIEKLLLIFKPPMKQRTPRIRTETFIFVWLCSYFRGNWYKHSLALLLYLTE